MEYSVQLMLMFQLTMFIFNVMLLFIRDPNSSIELYLSAHMHCHSPFHAYVVKVIHDIHGIHAII